MRGHLLLSLIASLSVLGAMGQTPDGSTAHREKAVEENLRYLAVIKGHPEPGMSLVEQMSHLHRAGCEHRSDSR